MIVLLAAGGPAGQEYEATAPLAADTLRYELTAGQSLVVSLPGPDEAEFRGVRLPALSWIVDRSFGWRTLPAEEGREYVLIQRRTPARVDTLVLVVDVRG